MTPKEWKLVQTSTRECEEGLQRINDGVICGLQEAEGGLRADEVRYTEEGAVKTDTLQAVVQGYFSWRILEGLSTKNCRFDGGQAGDTVETPLLLHPEVMAEGLFLSKEIEQAALTSSVGANATSGSIST